MAFVNKAYRTHDFNILFGHSYGGMFSVYTLFTNPDLFDAHIAASPSLMYGDEFVVQKVEEILANETKLNNQIYLSIGDEPNYYDSLDKLTALLTKNDSGLTWTLEKYADEDHGSIPFRTIADGLEFVYADWQLPNETAMKGVEAIQEHYQNRLNKYGIVSQITEATLNAIGYQLLQSDNDEKAIEIFKYNVELYPKSANVYDSLGDGYDKIGNLKKAIKNYQKAVSIAELINDANLQAFKDNLERAKATK